MRCDLLATTLLVEVKRLGHSRNMSDINDLDEDNFAVASTSAVYHPSIRADNYSRSTTTSSSGAELTA
jgi:hypothetical protein